MSPLASVAARGPREETKHLKICHWPPPPPPPSTISSLCHLNIPASVSLDARFSHGAPSGPSQSRALVPRPPPRPVPLPTPVSSSWSRMPLHCLSLHEGEEVTGRVRNLEQPPDLDLELGGPSHPFFILARFPTCITWPLLPFFFSPHSHQRSCQFASSSSSFLSHPKRWSAFTLLQAARSVQSLSL